MQYQQYQKAHPIFIKEDIHQAFPFGRVEANFYPASSPDGAGVQMFFTYHPEKKDCRVEFMQCMDVKYRDKSGLLVKLSHVYDTGRIELLEKIETTLPNISGYSLDFRLAELKSMARLMPSMIQLMLQQQTLHFNRSVVLPYTHVINLVDVLPTLLDTTKTRREIEQEQHICEYIQDLLLRWMKLKGIFATNISSYNNYVAWKQVFELLLTFTAFNQPVNAEELQASYGIATEVWQRAYEVMQQIGIQEKNMGRWIEQAIENISQSGPFVRNDTDGYQKGYYAFPATTYDFPCNTVETHYQFITSAYDVTNKLWLGSIRWHFKIEPDTSGDLSVTELTVALTNTREIQETMEQARAKFYEFIGPEIFKKD